MDCEHFRDLVVVRRQLALALVALDSYAEGKEGAMGESESERAYLARLTISKIHALEWSRPLGTLEAPEPPKLE